MFRSVRRYSGAVLEALQGIRAQLQSVAAAAHVGPDDDLVRRVDELERSRALWEAELEGQLAKAEQERKNARNAEERARGMLKRVTSEGDADGLEDLPEEYLAAVRGRNGDAGEAEGMPAVRSRVGLSREERKAMARAYKFGR